MKRIKFWFLILIPFVFSCSEEELQLNDEILDTEGVIARITSDISGSSCGSPGGILTLTYSADFNPNDVNWSIQSGNISIIGGQGTNRVTLRFASNFNGGSVFAIGSAGNGGIVYSDPYTISKCSSEGRLGNRSQCTLPTSIGIRQEIEECVGDFVVFSATVPSNSCPGSFSWTSWGDGSIVTTPNDATITAETYGPNFSVTATYTSAGGSSISRSWQTIFSNNGCFGEISF